MQAQPHTDTDTMNETEGNNFKTVTRKRHKGKGLIQSITRHVYGVCSFKNLGNTCFMNAALQCLTSLCPMIKFFEGYEDGERGTLTGEFRMLLRVVWSGTCSSTDPTSFRNLLRRHYKILDDGKQHNSLEFMLLFLKDMHEELVKQKTGTRSEEKAIDYGAHFKDTKDSSTSSYKQDSKRRKLENLVKCEDEDAIFQGDQLTKVHGIENSATDDVQMELMPSDVDKNKCHFIKSQFQGELKTTVTCNKCQHVSQGKKPFWHLALPLPLLQPGEKQLSVIYVQRQKNPVRYLVSLNQYDSVLILKKELQKLIGNDRCELTLAEVFNNHIARILHDPDRWICHVNIKDRIIYAFEKISIAPQSSDSCDGSLSLASSSSDAESFSNENATAADHRHFSRSEDEWGVGGAQPDKFRRQSSFTEVDCAIEDQCVQCWDNTIDHNIKMYECVTCRNKLCHTCLGSFKKGGQEVKEHINHDDDDQLECPVQGCDNDRPGKKFELISEVVPETRRVLKIPVAYRNDRQGENKVQGKLFGHPNILHLPKKLSIKLLYETVDKIVPFAGKYKIILTDGQGYRCSRCKYPSGCKGCEIVRNDDMIDHVDLLTSDHLTVRYIEHCQKQINSTSEIEDHISMEQKIASEKQLTLSECFEAFTARKILQGWCCPSCGKEQQATEEVKMSYGPETLIIELKRCGPQGKLHNEVNFPVEMVDFSSFSSDCSNKDLLYELQSCICHHGQRSESGHYTAYAKNPKIDKWFHYDDHKQHQGHQIMKISAKFLFSFTNEEENLLA